MKHFFVIAVFVLFAVASCKQGKTKTEEAVPAKTEEAGAANNKGPKPIVDVPSLVGKNIDEVKKLVGVAPFDVKESEISFYLPEGGPAEGPFRFKVKYFGGDEKPDEFSLTISEDFEDSLATKTPIEFAKFGGIDLTGIAAPPEDTPEDRKPWDVKVGGATARLYIGGSQITGLYSYMSFSIPSY